MISTSSIWSPSGAPFSAGSASNCCSNCSGGSLTRVVDVGLGAVAALGRLGVPLAVGCLVFDHLGASRRALPSRGTLGGGKGRSMIRKRLRKHAVDGVGPAAVMFDDFVGDVRR